ncbi:MAG: hypothetical protein GY772_11215, partial [bacterium]|nr:hypothetical protein [bacterium]
MVGDKARPAHAPAGLGHLPFGAWGRAIVGALHGLFGDAVKVVLSHAARGLSVDIVHSLRHRRRIDTEDQYHGVQSDLNREYISLTRGRHKTTMWLEHQPFGYPGGGGQGSFKASLQTKESCVDYAKKRNAVLQEL